VEFLLCSRQKHNEIQRYKLKSIKVDLKEWNRDVFEHLDTEKKRIMKEIEVLDIQDDVFDLEGHARLKRMDLTGQLRVINKKLKSLFR